MKGRGPATSLAIPLCDSRPFLFYPIGRVGLIDEAAFIQLADDSTVNQVLDFQISHRRISLGQEALDVAQAFGRWNGFRIGGFL